MADFAGWDPSELKSRVDVTRYLCAYIRENGLQNPDDRRKIVVDNKLKDLLNYGDNESEPLTYPNLQRVIQPLFER
jgi:chromatin remodeling complex protein RSC6